MKPQKLCNAIAKTTGKQCQNRVHLGASYCWHHLPKKESFCFLIIGGLIGLLLQIGYEALTVSPEEEGIKSLIKKEEAKNKPDLVVLKAEGGYDAIRLTIRNVGKQPADKVDVVFTTNNIPSSSIEYTAIWHEEFPSGVERSVPTFPIQALIDSRNILSPESERTLLTSLDEFSRGEMMLWFRFHLEYFFGDKKISSDAYRFALDKERGVLFFGKATGTFP